MNRFVRLSLDHSRICFPKTTWRNGKRQSNGHVSADVSTREGIELVGAAGRGREIRTKGAIFTDK